MNFWASLVSLSSSVERETIIDNHRLDGTHRVRYTDGAISQPFSHKVACDYAKIFGGTVIPK